MTEYYVIVDAYRIVPQVEYGPFSLAYMSTHRSPYAAARRLASIIAGRSLVAQKVRRAIPKEHAGRYYVSAETGQSWALADLRKYLSEEAAKR